MPYKDPNDKWRYDYTMREYFKEYSNNWRKEHPDQVSKYNKDYSKTHREQRNKYHREWARKEKNTDTRKVWCWDTIKYHKRKGYIINIEFNELNEHARKTNRCEYCGTELNWNPEKGKGQWVQESPTLDRVDNDSTLDHIWENDHNTSGAIAIICHQCNAGKQQDKLIDWILKCKTTYDNIMNTIIT